MQNAEWMQNLSTLISIFSVYTLSQLPGVLCVNLHSTCQLEAWTLYCQMFCQQLVQILSNVLSPTCPAYANVMPTIFFSNNTLARHLLRVIAIITILEKMNSKVLFIAYNVIFIPHSPSYFESTSLQDCFETCAINPVPIYFLRYSLTSVAFWYD